MAVYLLAQKIAWALAEATAHDALRSVELRLARTDVTDEHGIVVGVIQLSNLRLHCHEEYHQRAWRTVRPSSHRS